MPRTKKEQLPDYDALDDLGFLGWGKLTPIGEVEIPKRIREFLRQQKAKKAAAARQGLERKRRTATSNKRSRNSR